MRASDIPLPRGIGYLLPQQRTDEVIMYGPGSLGFQMTRASARGVPRQGLILWQHPGVTRTGASSQTELHVAAAHDAHVMLAARSDVSLRAARGSL